MTEKELILLGVDWGSEQHQVCVLNGDGEILREELVAHSGEALNQLADELIALVQGDASKIRVAIEVPRGPIVETLLERGMAVFAINPKQLDRFRDRHGVSGAKDDRRDAFVLADSLRTDLKKYRKVELGDPLVIQLRELTRMHEELKGERVMLGNRLLDQLRRYFPQVLELGSVYESRWVWELLEMAPSPELGRRLAPAKITRVLRRHRIRRITADEVSKNLQKQALCVADGVVAASSQHVRMLIKRLRVVDEQQTEVVRQIEALLERLSEPAEGEEGHRDAYLLRTLPGLGRLGCATMLAEAWTPLAHRDYQSLRGFFGSSPVTKKSGKQYQVIQRMACNHRLRNTLHYWAKNAVQRETRAKNQYARLRAAGHSDGRALRGVGDRLLAVAVAMLRSRKPYDPELRNRRAVESSRSAA